MTGKIHGISLGPGDPDLISVKGLRILKAADRIYYPGSLGSDGARKSFSLKILGHYGLETFRLRGFFVPMNGRREDADPVYDAIYGEMREDYRQGLSVAVVSEGDISFYSTFGYLLEKIRRDDLELEMIPGPTAFLLAASQYRFPLAWQRDRIAILPRLASLADLERSLKDFETVVLLKITGFTDELKSFLRKTATPFLYGENLGRPEQFLTGDIRELEPREPPYFSLLIFGRHLERNLL